MVKSRITLQKALGTVVWHRAGGFALVQALLPDRLFIINGIVIANRVFGGNIGGFGGGFLLGFQRCLVIGKGVQGVSAHFIHNACCAGAAQVAQGIVLGVVAAKAALDAGAIRCDQGNDGIGGIQTIHGIGLRFGHAPLGFQIAWIRELQEEWSLFPSMR